MTDKDKKTRYELSALYRILHMYGMTDLANQCAGARSLENKSHSFVHPYGMFYEEITASSLVKIDKQGKPVDSSSTWLNDGCINLAQWIFNARENVNFYVHGHAEDVMAVGGTKEGLMYLSQAAVYLNHLIGYVDYEFVEDKDFGKKFMSLIKQHDILITRNHGYYVVGKTASEAFFRAYYLEQACSVQVKNLSMGLKTHEIDKQKAAYFWENMSGSNDYNYDGKKSKFNYLWLRDNCPTAHDKDSRHRMFNILKVSNNINPKKFTVNDNGKLEIEWSEGDHISYYDQKWLRENCYTIKNNLKYKSPYQLWDNSLQNDLKSIEIDHDEIMSSDEGLVKWLKLLHHTGIAVVKNAPTENNSGFKILNRISHTRETFFKTPFEVINIPKPNNSAYTAHGLRNHMDLPWFETPPGYQFLHCLINSAEGGDSSAVDGFAVADYLKNNEKEIFDTLVNVYLKFRDMDYTQESIRSYYAPAISLTKDKDYHDIRFSVATMDALDCHPDLMDKVYKAHHRFGNLLHDDKFQIKFRLEAGDIFSFNNRRLLHGRTEFDPNSGHRHLQGYYMDRDEIIGRLKYLKNNKDY